MTIQKSKRTSIFSMLNDNISSFNSFKICLSAMLLYLLKSFPSATKPIDLWTMLLLKVSTLSSHLLLFTSGSSLLFFLLSMVKLWDKNECEELTEGWKKSSRKSKWMVRGGGLYQQNKPSRGVWFFQFGFISAKQTLQRGLIFSVWVYIRKTNPPQKWNYKYPYLNNHYCYTPKLLKLNWYGLYLSTDQLVPPYLVYYMRKSKIPPHPICNPNVTTSLFLISQEPLYLHT